jgi:hypothetical protein
MNPGSPRHNQSISLALAIDNQAALARLRGLSLCAVLLFVSSATAWERVLYESGFVIFSFSDRFCLHKVPNTSNTKPSKKTMTVGR